MLRGVGCRLPAQSTRLRAGQPQRRGHRCPIRAAQSARMRAQQRGQLGHVIGVQAQSTLLRARQPHRFRQSAACSISTIRTLAHAATVPVPPIRRLAPAQSARMRAQQPTSQLGHLIWFKHNPRACAHGNRTGSANPLFGTSTIRAYARTATAAPGHRCPVRPAQSARLRARQRWATAIPTPRP